MRDLLNPVGQTFWTAGDVAARCGDVTAVRDMCNIGILQSTQSAFLFSKKVISGFLDINLQINTLLSRDYE